MHVSQAKYLPLHTLLIIIPGVIAAEVLAMAVLYFVPQQNYLFFVLLDTVIMALLIVPLLYFFSFQPLLLQMQESQQATAAMMAMNEELRRTNEELQALTRAEQQQRRRAEVLAAASVALAQSLDLDLVSQLALDYVNHLVPFDCAAVVLRESEERLIVRARRPGGEAEASRPAAPLVICIEEFPHLQAMLATQGSVCIDDIQQDVHWPSFSCSQDTRSWLGVPLVAGGSAIGFLSMEQRNAAVFTEEHVGLAEALAGQAAVAIQNAWLFEQVRLGSEHLQALSRRLVEIQESERHYISRELHDEAGQALTALVVALNALEADADHPQRVRGHVAGIDARLQQLGKDLDRLARALRPEALDHLGLEAAVRQHLDAVAARHRLEVNFETAGLTARLPENVETILYRVIQEALTNVARHAYASRVDVLLQRRGDRLVAVVEDDGVGFEPEQNDESQRLGMLGMRERAEMLGGSLVVESAPGKGTTLVVEVPYGDPHSGS